MKTKKFKVGDKVKVIKNSSYHHFKIGEIITIKLCSKSYSNYYFEEGCWVLGSDEFELVK